MNAPRIPGPGRSARGYSAAVEGITARLVEVEVTVRRGSPKFVIVGLPDPAVRESRDRVRTALDSSGFPFPVERTVLVNLAPASRRKTGPVYDLPIALGILAATALIPPGALREHVILGELALDGRIRGVRGILPIAMRVRRAGRRALLVPRENGAEASVLPGLPVHPAATLAEAVEHLTGTAPIPPLHTDPTAPRHDGKGAAGPDLADVRGQLTARRALEIAAAGNHNLLFVGPPGAGKTMLARRLPGILPPLTLPEALEATTIHSVAGELGEIPILRARPFRAPHHSISMAGLIGGGPIARPGEASLAHRGVLFLDELPEFDRRALQALRQPLEGGRIRISRVGYSVLFPARFLLVAAMNPCPCGRHGVDDLACTCTPPRVEAYRGRVSGPLLDRIDLRLNVPRVRFAELAAKEPGESSAAVRARVRAARALQAARAPARPGATNASMTSADTRRLCALEPACRSLLEHAVETLGISARAHDRVLRVARTIADLASSAVIEPTHLSEALHFRPA